MLVRELCAAIIQKDEHAPPRRDILALVARIAVDAIISADRMHL